ncbi:uncharacterized protein V1516DRAFT_678225 [Lipomyces oligophaga]|uniref:uncharacterized protein n=1 Tax=Lipomyces oligophaga TaxID=45792 RepID=UPI0034CF7D59
MANSRQQSTIHVGGLDSTVTEQDLQHTFVPFGDIVEIQLPKDPKSREPHRGFALIEFEYPMDAEAAIDNMHLSELNGKVIRVKQSRPQKEKFDIQNARTAVWDQESWMEENVVDHADRQVFEQSLAEAGNGHGNKEVDAMEGLEIA